MNSFIRDVKPITEKQAAFVANSQNANAQTLADYLPNGPFYVAKNLANSKFRKMLSSLALELIRKENAIQTIADEYYPFTAQTLLEQWEAALGIPDACFTVDGVSLDRRQRQVIAKLAFNGLITADDFIALAAFFDFEVTISELTGTSMKVTFVGLKPEPRFPYTFPMTFPSGSITGFLECFITKLAPAHIQVIFQKGV